MKYTLALLAITCALGAVDVNLEKYVEIIGAIKGKDEQRLLMALKDIAVEYSYGPGERGANLSPGYTKEADVKILLVGTLVIPDNYEIQVRPDRIIVGWVTEKHWVERLQLESRDGKLVFIYGHRSDQKK